MGSVNKVILVGNLGRDAELRYTPGGAAVATINMATTEVWNDKAGQRQEKTEWHRVVIFNERLTELAEKYLRKGSKVYVEGALQTRKWTDKDGNESIAIRSIQRFTLGFDHRIVDGADAGKFMSDFKAYLENWSEDIG